MQHQATLEASEIPDVRMIAVAEVFTALRAGLSDFLRAPGFGLFFASVYVTGGLVLDLVLAAIGKQWWLIPFAVGFPILAPFAAVGLYEVSRRLEQGLRLDWREVLGVVFRQKDRQIPSISVVILLVFMFWMFVAHVIFLLFMGLSALNQVNGSLWFLLTPNGIAMMVVGGGMGAIFAAVLFSITVVGLPLLLDKEVDFVTAMITSVSVVLHNPVPMLVWALLIAGLLFVGMLPLFLGLFIVLPVLGHASWHIYRATLKES